MLPAPTFGFILLFGSTCKLLPPTSYGTAVQSLQPFPAPYHAGFKRDTPLCNIFIPLWMFACLKAEHMPSSCLHSGGTGSGAPVKRNLHNGGGLSTII